MKRDKESNYTLGALSPYGSVSGWNVKEKAEGFRHEAINSEFDAKNILGVHSVFQVRLDWIATRCKVQKQRSERLFNFAQRANPFQAPS